MNLNELPVLVLDCQATSADPSKGHLLEAGWCTTRAGSREDDLSVEARVARLPDGASIPLPVKRITGLMEEDAVPGERPEEIFEALRESARALARSIGSELCPTVAHFASFEARYLRLFHLRSRCGGRFPFQILCTHRIAKGLLPELPRRSLRAVAGYFGHGVSELRRATDHVRATATVWRRAVSLLAEEHGVETLDDLLDWLDSVAASRGPGKRSYPMPPPARLELPRNPGIYRMLRGDGGVLYVGKASSLRERVASYFRRRAAHGDRTLEMLSQARDVAIVVTGSALEAALEEVSEIHRLSPPYNRALRPRNRALVFADRELRHFAESPDREHRIGPLPHSSLWASLAAIRERRAPREGPLSDAGEAFACGLAIFEKRLGGASLLGHGAREWLSKRSEENEDPGELRLLPETGRTRPLSGAEEVADGIDVVVRRASHLVRRSHWHRVLSESTLVWRGRGGERIALVVEGGRVRTRALLEEGEPAPLPSGWGSPSLDRAARIDVLGYDCLTVLTREMRRLVDEGREVSLLWTPVHRAGRRKLARLLRWI